jgi:uncharacterized protein (TIGR02466 family)
MHHNIYPLFPIIVHEIILPDFNDVKKNSLIDKIYLEKDKSCGVQKTNVGGWQSEDILDNELFYNDINYIISNIDLNFGFNLCGMWINVNGSGNYNKSHVHPGASLSGVFYVETSSKTGDIYFENPNRYCSSLIIRNYEESLNLSFNHTETYRFSPSPGTILIFPGDLSHHVEKNNAEHDRISIAFNLNF